MASANILKLRESLSDLIQVESIILNVFQHLPLGILVMEFPSRRCILTNALLDAIIPESLVGKVISVQSDGIIDENKVYYNCSKVSACSFAIGDKQYLSYVITKPKKEVHANHDKQSPIWL